MSIKEITKLYKEYCLGQNAEKVKFIRTVDQVHTVRNENDEVVTRIHNIAYIFRIFDTVKKTTLFTLVDYDSFGDVTEIDYFYNLDDAVAAWEENQPEESTEE